MMDTILCDELLQEIFHQLPPPSSPAVSLVSKRWLRLLRSSTSSLTLRFTSPHHHPTIFSLSTFLSQHPFLHSLSLITTSTAAAVTTCAASGDSSDHLLLCVSTSCPNLRQLRFLAGPLSSSPLLSLSSSCNHITSLTISLSRPLSFNWLTLFTSLRDLSLFLTGNSTDFNYPYDESIGNYHDVGLNLETLCITGIKVGDFALIWIWRNCKKVKTLKLKSCEGVGDNTSFSAFIKRLKGLQEVELRTCRTIVDGVLLKLAESCVNLESLLVYDGGSKEGLLQFITQSRGNLRKLDFRLPLDLDNNHLIAMAENFRCLSSLRLQSCCLVTGEGLKALSRAMISDRIEELGLINCDVVERETGLLTTLGQCFKKLRKLDLSYNDMLMDKQFISMLVSCSDLRELKLRGCSKLSSAALVSLAKSCKQLQSVDVMYCCGIGVEGMELFVLNSHNLRRVEVEQSKLSNVARSWASNKHIEIVT